MGRFGENRFNTGFGMTVIPGYIIMQPTEHTAHPKDNHFAVHQDNAGNIWVGHLQGGLCKYVPSKANFEIEKHTPGSETGLDHNFITALHEDTNRKLWVATKRGLHLEQDNGSLARINLRQSAWYKNWITKILSDSTSGKMFLGFWGGGLWEYDLAKNVLIETYEENTFMDYTINTKYGIWLSDAVMHDRCIVSTGWGTTLNVYDIDKEKFTTMPFNMLLLIVVTPRPLSLI